MSTPTPMPNDEAVAHLRSLLNQSLRIHITDGRMFVGQMKCTDHDRNVILATAHEYRRPSRRAVEAAATAAAAAAAAAAGDGKVRSDMIKRFVGLVVVPGRYITKIELD